MSDYKSLTLFSPDVPYQGMRSKPDATMLKPGEWVLWDGFRYEDGTARVRDGISALTASASGSSPTFLGAAALALNGTNYMFAAYAISGATRIFRVDSSGTWTEMTDASGDNTYDMVNRFTSTTARVTFTVVRDSDESPVYNLGSLNGALDYLVIQNGVEAPRVWSNVNLISPTRVGVVTPHVPITFPNNGSQIPKVKATWPVYLTMSGATMPTYTTSDADVTIAATGTSPDNHTQATFTNATDNGDWVKMDWQTALTPINLSNSKQLAFIYDTTNPLIWQYLKVEISEDDASYTTVYDPTNAAYSYQLVEMDDVGKMYCVAFPLDQITSASRDAIDFIRLTWVGNARVASDSTITLNLYTIAGTGKVQGNCQYAISYFNSSSRAESISKIISNHEGQKLSELGSRDINDSRIPESDILYYTYKVTCQNTSTAARDAGVDTLRLYRRDPGEAEFTLVNNWFQIAAWTAAGAWAYSSGSEYSVLTLTDSYTIDQKLNTISKPDAFHKVVPVSGAQLGASGRLFCGNVLEAAGSIQRYGDVWFSEKKYPFRFRTALEYFENGMPNPRSANTISFSGEKVKGFAKTGGGSGEAIWIFTDKWLYMISGLDSYSLGVPRPVGQHGTPAERSITAYQNSIWYLDNDKQIRVFSMEGSETPSRNTVEDKFYDSADISTVSTVYYRERLYAAYRPNGGSTNSHVVTFNDKWGFWEFDDTLPSPCTAEQLVVFNDSNTLKLFCFASNGKVYRYEDPSVTQDLGASIACAMTGREIHDNMWNRFAMHEFEIVCSDVASGTITTGRTAKPDGSTSAGVFDVDVDTNQAWRIDVQTDGSRPSVSGVSVQPTLSGSLLGAKKIWHIGVRVEPLDDGFDIDAS